MSLAEKTFENADGPELTDVALRLEADAHALLVELMQRTACDASELVGWALGAYWRELEGIVLPALPVEDIEAALTHSEDDIRAGRTSSNEDVFGRIAAKHGW